MVKKLRESTRKTRKKQPALIAPRGPKSLYDFSKLAAEDFEEAVCFLMTAEPGIEEAQLHNAPRQDQYGVDVIAGRRNSPYIEVGSCKCYGKVVKGQLAKFSDEFLDHYDTVWRDRKVKRFILAVACDLKSKERRAEIAVERERFKALKIQYQCWDQRSLTNRGRRHAGFLVDFIGEAPGAPPAPEPVVRGAGSTGTSLVDAALIEQIHMMQRVLGGEVQKRLDRLEEKVRTGGHHTVRADLEQISQSEAQWTSADAETKTRLLRMRALDRMAQRAFIDAEALIEEAKRWSKKPERRMKALLAQQRGNHQEALALVASPDTPEEALLRAGLLLEAGDVEQADSVLVSWRDRCPELNEWRRLKTFVHLERRDLAAAEAEWLELEAVSPNWTGTRYLEGVIAVRRAVSPAATEAGGMSWPEPVYHAFVQRDTASQEHLRRAKRIFADLIARSEHKDDPLYSVWKYACLLMLSQPGERIEDAAAAEVARSNFHPLLVFWSLLYGVPLDYDRVERVLSQRREQSPQDGLIVQALIACALRRSAVKRARNLLRIFSNANRQDPATHEIQARWTRRIAAASGGRITPGEQAAEMLDEIVGDPDKVDDARIRQVMNDKTQPAADRMMVALALAARDRWAVLAPVVEDLCVEIGTAEAMRLAGYALFNSGQSQKAIDLLQNSAARFANDRLPLDVRRLVARARVRVGAMTSALSNAAELARESGLREDSLFLARLQAQIGDRTAAMRTLRPAIEGDQFVASEMIGLLPMIAAEDEELARKVLRRALQEDAKRLGPGLLPWMQRLGLDQETRRFIDQLLAPDHPAAGQLIALTLDELLGKIKESQAAVDRAFAGYLSGHFPIHLVAEKANWNLAIWWAKAFANSAEQPLLIRSGNRGAEFFERESPPRGRLSLDVTGALSLMHLDLVEEVFAAFPDICVPKNLQSSLLAMADELAQDRTGLREIRDALDAAVASGDISVIPKVDFCSGPSYRVAVAASDQPDVTHLTPGTLLAHAIRLNAIAAPEAAVLQKAGGIWATPDPLPGLDQGVPILIDVEIVDWLLRQHLLVPLGAKLPLCIDEETAAWAANERDLLDKQFDAGRAVARLVQRIAVAIEAGRCTWLPEFIDEDATPGGSLDSILREIVGARHAVGDWIWCDDRVISSYTSAGSGILVTSHEILRDLRARQFISETTYQEKRAVLRRSALFWIPFELDEVMAPLIAAPVIDGKLTESDPLVMIRRRFAAAALQAKNLRREQSQQNPTEPELRTLLESGRLLGDILRAIWDHPGADGQWRLSASNWAWSVLRLEWLAPDLAESVGARLWWMSLVRLLMVAFEFPDRRSGEATGRRQQYLSWLEATVADLTEAAEPEALSVIAELTAQGFREAFNSQGPPKTEDEARARTNVIAHFCHDLPQAIRRRVYQNAEFLAEVRPSFSTTVDVGTEGFEADAFWDAIAAACRGEVTTVSTIKTKRPYTIRRDQNALSEFAFLLEGESRLRISDPALALLSDDLNVRLAYLEHHAEEFAPTGRERADLFTELAGLPSLSERFDRVRALQENTAEGRYNRLEAVISHSQTFSVSLLRPAFAAAVAQWLRISPDAINVDWDESSASLIEAVGPEETLRRIGGLPIPLPTLIRSWFEGLNEEDRRRIIGRTIENPRSILRVLRALELVQLAQPLPDLEERLRRLLLDRWDTGSQSLAVLLQWSAAQWEKDPTWREAGAGFRLACVWAHAERTDDVFSRRSADPAWIAEYFSDAEPHHAAGALRRDLDFNADVAAPRHFSRYQWLAQELGRLERLGMEWSAEDQLALLGKLTHPKSSEVGRIPHLELFANTFNAQNALGTYLSAGLPNWVVEALLLDGSPVLARANRQEAGGEIARLLEADANDFAGWLSLGGAQFDFLRPDDQVRIDHAIASLRYPLREPVGDELLPLGVAQGILSKLSNATQDSVLASLRAWARRAKGLPLSDAEQAQDVKASPTSALYMESLIALSLRDDSVATLTVLRDRIRDSLIDWPALAPAWRALIHQLLRRMSRKESRVIWELHLHLGSLP